MEQDLSFPHLPAFGVESGNIVILTPDCHSRESGNPVINILDLYMIGKKILHYKILEKLGSSHNRHAESRRRTDPSTDGLDSASSSLMRSRNKSAGRQIPASGGRFGMTIEGLKI